MENVCRKGNEWRERGVCRREGDLEAKDGGGVRTCYGVDLVQTGRQRP